MNDFLKDRNQISSKLIDFMNDESKYTYLVKEQNYKNLQELISSGADDLPNRTYLVTSKSSMSFNI